MSSSTGSDAIAPAEPSAHAGPNPIAFAAMAVSTPSGDGEDAVWNVGELDGAPEDPTKHLAPGPRPQPRLVDAHTMDAGELVGLDVLKGRKERRMPPGRKFRMVWFDVPLCCRVKPKHGAGIVRQDEPTKLQVKLGSGPARVNAAIPDKRASRVFFASVSASVLAWNVLVASCRRSSKFWLGRQSGSPSRRAT